MEVSIHSFNGVIRDKEQQLELGSVNMAQAFAFTGDVKVEGAGAA